MRLFLCVLVLFVYAATPASPQESARPNIVCMMADDLGWADVGFHGGNAATPHLDALARENLELLQHYVAPVCSPTRTGLLTGRCWSRFGVTSPQNTRCLPWDTLTLPVALKEAGYDTCLVGKWHLGSLPKWGPNRFGFDHAYGSLAGGVSPWNHRYKKGEFSVTWHRNGELIEEAGHVTDLIAAEAVQWIGQRGDRPFFLYVPFTAVHLPLKEPPSWVRRVPDAIAGEVPRHYAASVMHLDDAVGQILAALQRAGKRDNTLVVFTSDNGGSTAENNDLKYPDDNCPNGRLVGNNLPLRGQKGSVYEGGTRVPTIVSWPARGLAGKVETPLQITDWMPTLCRLAGSKPESEPMWDGIDISSLLLEGTSLAPRPMYTVGPNWRERSLRLGAWKLVMRGEGDSRKVELFNIVQDASETRDMAKTQPDRLQQLLSELDRVSANDRDAVVARD